MLDKIIVPIDSIEHDNTLNAAKAAITISRGCSIDRKLELIFLHVLSPRAEFSLSEKKMLNKKRRKEMEEEFEALERMCKDKGIENFKTVLREGNPTQEILKLALDENADLITIGSGKIHDRSVSGRIKKFFYGSVTEEVIHEAPCSILVTKPEMSLEKLLVPVDSIEWDNTMMGVENAMDFARGCSGERPELIFMHVLHSPNDTEMSEERLKMERRRIQSEFSEIKELCSEKEISSARTIIKPGDPEKEKGVDEEIAETAKKEDIDIVVMGSGKLHDRSTSGRFQKFTYGSVTEKVIHETPCSILIARPIS